MSEIMSFSRTGLAELTEEFSSNLRSTQQTFEAVKKEFLEIQGKWTGGDSENATRIFKSISTTLGTIEGDLTEADNYIKQKSDAFNQLHFNA